MIAEEKRAWEMGVADDDIGSLTIFFLFFFGFFFCCYCEGGMVKGESLIAGWVGLFSSFLFGFWVVFLGEGTWI